MKDKQQKAEYDRKRYQALREEILVYQRQYRATHKQQISEYHRRYKRRAKTEVLWHYSKGEPHCACCGERRIEFLCIDHIQGGGNVHRKTNKTVRGSGIYIWLKLQGFPEGFRVLCYNCNCSLGFYGYCPHEKEREYCGSQS